MPTLSDIAELIMGQSPPSSSYNEEGLGLPFFQGKSDFGFIHPTVRIYCDSPKKTADVGDILISVRAPVGPTNIADQPCSIGRGLAAIRAKHDEIDGCFLYFNLKYIESYIESLGSGSTFKAINKALLGSVTVNQVGFPLDEQRKIAAVLSLVQRAIGQQERLIALTTELKQSLMNKLFTEGLHGEPQNQTEIGPVPESWALKPLGSLARVGNGSTPKRSNPDYWTDGDIPWLNSTKIHELFIESADQFVTPAAVRECHLPLVPAGSLLIAITGQGKTLGNSALVQFDTCINQHLAYAKFTTNEVLSEFVLWYMQTRYEYLRSIAQAGGSTKGALTCGFLKTVPIPFPKIEEQQEIVAVFDLLHQKTVAIGAKRRTFIELFQALLHQLMTGQVQVNDLDLSGLL